ncbi:RecA-family ATPase [Afipia massiliensis]|uniref:RecA-family ATPase n=1 Tax=Afipia massiliensis TaxID=211460 RepID=A0A840MYZ6_9BRAD|nr:AAA family ATPase [Afipia massiliensis]MBB5053053.1 RecA-family ATPase [Afipia massiliensis]
MSVGTKRMPTLDTHANDNNPQQATVDAETLLGMHFEPLEYIIPNYVVEGLTVLGGKPKMGKSWWAYDAAIAVATGGKAMGTIPCQQGDVIYLALEDNLRRVADRIRTLTPLRKKLGLDLKRLKIRVDAPRIDNGLLTELDKWRESCVNPRLVIIDVYMKVRAPRKRGEDVYAADYAAVVPLQQYAAKNHIAIVLVTHTRKMEAEDPLESISGTNGVTGAADAVLVLSRNSTATVLYGRGRDIEEIETAMKFDAGRWMIIGDAAEVKQSYERRKILRILRESISPLAPKDIAEQSGLKPGNVRTLLGKMMKAGEITKPEPSLSLYCTPITPVTPITPSEV